MLFHGVIPLAADVIHNVKEGNQNQLNGYFLSLKVYCDE